ETDHIEDGIEIKLLTPLAGEFFPEEGYDWEGELGGGGELLDGTDLLQYMEPIQMQVDLENNLEEEGGDICNLMEYFHGSDSIKEKVKSAIVSVESAEGVLYGCTTLRMKEYLKSEELYELCDYITGQYSDGWGEGFEQRDIRVDGGTLNVHFWQGAGMKFRTQTAEIKPDPGNGKTAEPEKGRSCQQVKKDRPKLQLIGHEGNIFSIAADACRLLSRNGQRKEADEMYDRVFQAGSYHEALGIISEYVETELSDVSEKKNQRKRKTEKTPCR
ncbi:hypothetical protein, partial [Schaedlerella sp.]|uniref:hypothetical protein n=1 Tax=Schaedlerella sp. TaxID=2676057 RepID=UPI0037483F1F